MQTLLCPNEKGCVSYSSLSHTLQAAEHAVRLSDLLCAKHKTHKDNFSWLDPLFQVGGKIIFSYDKLTAVSSSTILMSMQTA